MAATCASCGESIRYWTYNTYFCPACKTQSCDSCRRDDEDPCPACGSKRSGWRFAHIVFVFTVCFTLLAGFWFTFNLPTVLDQAQIEAMPVTPMADLTTDRVLKISGRIDSNLSVAIAGHEENRKGWSWVFDSNPITVADQNGGEKLVLNLTQATIFPGSHKPYPPPAHVEGSVYLPNDTVYAIGTIYHVNGTAYMDVIWLSSREDVFHVTNYMVNTAYSVVVFVIALVVFWGIFKGLEVNGRRAIARLPAKGKTSPWNFRPSEKVRTVKNRIKNPDGWKIIASGAATAGFYALSAYTYVLIPIGREDISRSGILILLLLGGMICIWLFVAELVPSVAGRYYIPISLSIGDDGFMAGFRDKTTKGFRWSDLRLVMSTTELEKPGKRSEMHGVIVHLKTGKTHAIVGLTGGNADAVSRAFQARYPDPEHDLMKALMTKAPREEILDRLADRMIAGVKLDVAKPVDSQEQPSKTSPVEIAQEEPKDQAR
jgi:hypothetical protein